MKYNLLMHHRRSIRKKGYDYSSCGAYFITMNTQRRESFFGCIIDKEMELNDSGLMIERWYNELPEKFPDAGIPRIIQWFKTMTTNEYICGVKKCRWMPFDKRLWQRNYYEHIIRNDEELYRIREYIKNNPREWHNKKSMYVEEPSEEYTGLRVCPKDLRVCPFSHITVKSQPLSTKKKSTNPIFILY